MASYRRSVDLFRQLSAELRKALEVFMDGEVGLAAPMQLVFRGDRKWLEDRALLAVFTPTTFADDGTAGSLRSAIAQANDDNGTATDTIQLQAGTY